ncbi:zinc finger BED domain-containing protein RICESLEEPER 2-like [Phaseolus vulgaris]|uniref:zinc finger BED domain-containing protein RICESLEEPER 2-like n=1 Tax=Phaseolus vulgaris TaxID=3885 RepID=UPI0035CA7AD5
MDEECNMPIYEFELEEDDNTEKQSKIVEPEKKKRDKTSTSNCWRNTVKADIGRMYMKEKIILKELIASIPSRICLTSDLWTSINIEGFISLTSHFVDLNRKLNTKLLNFCHMPPPYTGLKVLGDALDQIRNSIKYVKGSESRMVKFKQCFERFSDIDASSGLCLDVPTRWNSTYLMINSALKYQRVFGSLHLVDESYKYCPTEEEWERAGKICKFLLPFYEITNLISATSYPTSNLYFLQFWKIQCLLMKNVKDEDVLIKNMAKLMIVKFEKYWDEYSVVIAFGATLDPRMKLETLGFCFEKIDSLTWELKLEKIKEKIYKLFAEYSTKGFTTSSSVQKQKQGQSSFSSSMSKPSLFYELKMRKLQVANKAGRSQLDTYLDEPTLDFDYLEHMDVDLLSNPITTVASESTFSIGSRILNKYRNRLWPENVEAIICTSS